jgi:hypothetical protein
MREMHFMTEVCNASNELVPGVVIATGKGTEIHDFCVEGQTGGLGGAESVFVHGQFPRPLWTSVPADLRAEEV